MAHQRPLQCYGMLPYARRRATERRRAWSFAPRLGWLEDRMLLSSATASVSTPGYAPAFTPLALDNPLTATIAPSASTYYRISSDVGGQLIVTFIPTGFAARISLVDSQGQPLAQSDGPAPGAGDDLINVGVAAGDDFLEVQSLGAGGTYELTADLTPSVPPFQTLPSLFTGPSQLAFGDFDGDGYLDLAAPDGIHLGNGNGTFKSTVIDGPLADPGWQVTAIAAGDFNNDGRSDIAFTETNDGVAELCVLLNAGRGEFEPPVRFSTRPDPVAIQTIDFGNGVVDLAVADGLTNSVAIFVGDGHGGLSTGPVLPGGVQPSALVSGRFGDGYVDLIVADKGDSDTGGGQGLTVFQAAGPGQFHFSRTIDVGLGPSALAAGYFTGDGVLDLAVAEENSNDVTVLLNNGDGTFQAPRSYAVGGMPMALVACDFGNGHVDLATANSLSDDVSVLVGNGDGTFEPQLRFAVGATPESLVAADLSGDDRPPDLAVGDLGSGDDFGDISILLGRGDGTFQDKVENAVGDYPQGIVTADLTGDGHVDIVTTNIATNDISVLLGNGDGTFESAKFSPAGSGPSAIAVGDFNGDGRIDLAVADSGDLNGQGQGVSILLGNGDGTFAPPEFFETDEYGTSIVAGDFTGDGVLDLAVANSYSSSVSILLGDGRGGFTVLSPIPLLDQVSGQLSITEGDFGNGKVDLAVANQGSNSVSILMNDGRGAFTALPPIPVSGDANNLPSAIVSGDFQSNGVVDLAVASANTDGDNVTILLGQGEGHFDPQTPILIGSGLNPYAMTALPLAGDGPLGLAVADLNSNNDLGSFSVSLLAGDGTGSFQLLPALDLGSEGAPVSITTGDFTGDGRSDLAIGRGGPNSVAIELNQGGGDFNQPGPVGLVPRNTPLVAEFSGDGVPDVAIVDGAGDILFRAGVPGQPGTFAPPITINAGYPSRDIAAVAISRGTLLASVDATDNAVSVYGYNNGQFTCLGKLPTGAEPAQIVSADLEGNDEDDLVIRNAGSGSLTIYMSNGLGWFLPPISLPVGPGIADVSVADVNQDGLLDILLANQTAGEVEVMLNHAAAGFGPPTLYRAGNGLSAVIAASGTAPVSLTSLEGTVGVAAAPTSGGQPDIVALNAGSDTIGVLDGLEGGRFANPISLPGSGPTVAVAVADFNADGNADLAVLGPSGVTIWLSNGKGAFVPLATYDVGPDATGLSLADIDSKDRPDLVVGNPFGDVLVLMNEGNGAFKVPTIIDQSVALTVTHSSNGTPLFIYSDQSRDRVVEQTGSQAQNIVADRTTGLLVPGTAVLADLNNDGVMDLIVPNIGGNSVFVYPELPTGEFGPSMNNGIGFFTGTNPVSVLVADLNGDGRLDLIVADKGSNQVSILFNEPQGNSFTLVAGPRLNAGTGPVGLAYGDFLGGSIPDIAVSDSGSNKVMVLPGRGGGFFDDQNPIVVQLADSPGPIFAGPFGAGPGTDIVALDPGTGNVTLISGLLTGAATTRIFSSGGLDPVAAIAIGGPDGFEDLVVANNGDGQVALLAGGPLGLSVEEVSRALDQLSPTGLALASFQNETLEVYATYATTEGQETASLLVFSLGGVANPSAAAGAGIALLPLQESSLPLIATLLTPYVNFNQTETEAVGLQAVTSSSALTVSFGQGPLGHTLEPEEEEDDGAAGSEGEIEAQTVAGGAERSAWMRVMIGLDEAFEELRREAQGTPPSDDGPEQDENASPNADPSQGAPNNGDRLHESGRFEVLDEALSSLDETGPISAVMPTFGYERAQRMTIPRGAPGPLAGTSLSLPSGGLLLGFVVPRRRFHSARIGADSADRMLYRSRKSSPAGDR